MSTGKTGKQPLIARVRNDVAPLIGSPEHGIQIGIAIPLHDAQRNGLPTAAELPQLDAIEALIDAEVAERAVLVAVITTSGMREFVLYTGCGDWIPDCHHAL